VSARPESFGEIGTQSVIAAYHSLPSEKRLRIFNEGRAKPEPRQPACKECEWVLHFAWARRILDHPSLKARPAAYNVAADRKRRDHY
jgi:hypothetical protein